MPTLRTDLKVCLTNKSLKTTQSPAKRRHVMTPFYISCIITRSYHATRPISGKITAPLLSLFCCSLIYLKNCCMSVPGKHNISRSLWRFLEISLFFLVSVLGYSFLAKTSTFNAKLKSKEHATGIVASKCSVYEDSLLLSPTCEQQSLRHSHNPFYSIFHQVPEHSTPYVLLKPVMANIAFSFPFETNLFQQNPVLII